MTASLLLLQPLELGPWGVKLKCPTFTVLHPNMDFVVLWSISIKFPPPLTDSIIWSPWKGLLMGLVFIRWPFYGESSSHVRSAHAGLTSALSLIIGDWWQLLHFMANSRFICNWLCANQISVATMKDWTGSTLWGRSLLGSQFNLPLRPSELTV